MIIKKIKINGFGKLEDKDIDESPELKMERVFQIMKDISHGKRIHIQAN